MRLLDRLRPQPDDGELRGNLVDLYGQWNTTEDLPDHTYESWANAGMKSNPAVFSVMLARSSIFKQAAFHLERGRNQAGEPLETDAEHAALSVLRAPWPNGTVRDLLARRILHADISGNSFVYRPTRQPRRLQVLRPDWVQLLMEDPDDGTRNQVHGYVYTPGGLGTSRRSVFISVEEMSHWAPIPDPLHPWRGMSWLTPLVREINSHTDMSKHRGLFFKNAATPYLLVKVEQNLSDEQRTRLRNELERRHVGVENAYSNMVLTGGADATVIGRDLSQMNFTGVQASVETKIAAAGGVPAELVGFSEGAEHSSRTGYNLALRKFLDFTIRDLWTGCIESFETVLAADQFGRAPVMPSGWRLGLDEARISVLQQDARDTATTLRFNVSTVTQLVQQGFTPESAVAAVTAGDLTLLEHTGAVPTTVYDD